MAKQTSLIKINGKADGQSFYTSKNGGALMRSINKGMSARVKDAKEYINTRKNNAEFGACGNFAGVMIGAITQRWRFILDSIATGKMVKALKSAIVLDASGKWGERELQSAQAPVIRNVFNGLSKNEMIGSLASVLPGHVHFDGDDLKFTTDGTITMSDPDKAQLISLGADGAFFQYYIFKVAGLAFDPSSKTYSPATAKLKEVSAWENDVNLLSASPITVFTSVAEGADSVFQNADGEVNGVLAIMLPYRTVGGEKNILQQYCAAFLAEVAVP